MLWVLLEAPQWGASNEYPQHMFLWRTGEKFVRIIIKWAAPCKNVSSACGQRRLRSSCTSTQSDQGFKCLLTKSLDIGIKHGFPCINIRQVPRKVLKTEAGDLGTWGMLMRWKTMFDCFYCIKTENICYISRYYLHYFLLPFHRCLANAISTDYARSRARQYTSHNSSRSMAPVRSYWKLRSRALTARELPC